MRNNVKTIISNLVLLLLLMLSYSGNLFAQLSADNDGNLEVSPMNGGLKYSYPISNNSIDGYPITVKVNYVDNVMHKQFLDYKHIRNGERVRSIDGITSTSDTFKFEQNMQYWSYVPLSKPAWIMGVNGFAINILKNANGFVGKRRYDDFLVEGYDFCNRMSVLDIGNSDVIRILKDDGSVLELRNTRSIPNPNPVYMLNNYIKDSIYYTGKYYETGTNPSSYAVVEYDYAAEAIPFVSDTLYNNIPKADIYKNAMRTRILKYYKGDGLEYVFKEYIVPYGANWWKESLPGSAIPTSINAYVRHYAGVYPTIFYLDAINSSEKCLTKFSKKGHDYRNKDSLVYGRVPITDFANHKFTFGGDEATVQVFDKTYRFMLRMSNDDFLAGDYCTQIISSSNIKSEPNKVYSYGHEPDSIPTPSVVEKYVRKIVDPEGREVSFAYSTRFDWEYDLSKVSYSDSTLFSNSNEIFAVKNILLRNSISLKDRDGYFGWAEGREYFQQRFYPNYLNVIYDNSKAIKISYNLLPYEINFEYLNDNNSFHSVSEIVHYERNGANFNSIRSVKYSFSRGADGLTKHSSVDIYDYKLNKTDNMQYEYKKFNTVPPYIDNSYINPLKEYNIYLPSKVTTTRKYWDEALNTDIEELILTETEYMRADSIGGDSKIHYYPVSSKTTMRTLNNDYLSASTDSIQIQYKKNKYKFASINFFETYNSYYACEDNSFFNQVLVSDTSITYKPSNKDTLFTVHNKQVTNYLNLDLQKQDITTERYILDQNATNLLIDREILDGRNVAKVAAVMQPVLINSITYPMITGIPISNYLLDADNKIISGKSMVYNTTINPTNGRRGSLIRDSIVGDNGVALLNAEYNYHPVSKLLVETISPNGSKNKQYYKYSDVPDAGSSVSGKKLKNNDIIQPFKFEKIEYNYETPAVTESQVRYTDTNGNTQTRYLRNYFKKTYFGNNTGIIDNNGWLSAFDYDANGRLKTTWLPFDFPTFRLVRDSQLITEMT